MMTTCISVKLFAFAVWRYSRPCAPQRMFPKYSLAFSEHPCILDAKRMLRFLSELKLQAA